MPVDYTVRPQSREFGLGSPLEAPNHRPTEHLASHDGLRTVRNVIVQSLHLHPHSDITYLLCGTQIPFVVYVLCSL